MKQNTLILSAFCMIFVLGSCKSKSKKVEEVKHEQEALIDTLDNSNGYFMQTKFEQGMSAGKVTEFKFSPHLYSDTNATVELQLLHEKKMHVIIVKNDLSLFYHIHPTQSVSGEYSVPFNFNYGGDYIVFVDYAPVNANQQLERKEITVAGKGFDKKEYAIQQLTSKIEDFEVKLIPESKSLESGHAISFRSTISLNGKIIDANLLDNYLGAKAHMVIVSSDTKQFLHVHPMVMDKSLMLHTEFTVPGMYRGWLQFQYQGKLVVADFVFLVSEGSGHDHGSHDGHNKKEKVEHTH